jgi:hypothetical protein
MKLTADDVDGRAQLRQLGVAVVVEHEDDVVTTSKVTDSSEHT